MILATGISDVTRTFADFLPTAANLAQVELPDSLAIDGKSIAPTLLGNEQAELADRYSYWEFFEKGYQQAARWRDWKAIRLKPDAPLLLFDLARDAGERADVAAQNQELIKQFETYFRTARTESSAWPVEH